MKKIKLERYELMLLALLRASLHEKDTETSFFQQASENDWRKCYRLAASQGVMALAWDGVMKLPKELQPEINIKLSWATGVNTYEKKYKRYCNAAIELTRFYAEHGIKTLLLKGVGFSLLYPVPCHREGGDIDIFTFSADKSKMSDEEANRLADTLMQQQGISVKTDRTPKHSNFKFQRIPIENHRTFLNVGKYKISVPSEKMLREKMSPKETALQDGEILIPSPEFNTMFIAFHAAHHYGSGLALHHLCDWAIIIRLFGLQIPEEFKDRHFRKWMEAMTEFCNCYLGTSYKVEGDKKMVNKMMQEILHPRYSENVPTKNPIGILVYKTKRLLYTHQLRSSVLPASLTKRVWRSTIIHILNPKKIFQK